MINRNIWNHLTVSKKMSEENRLILNRNITVRYQYLKSFNCEQKNEWRELIDIK